MNKEEKGKHHIILVVTQKCKPIKNLDYYMCHNQCVFIRKIFIHFDELHSLHRYVITYNNIVR